MSFLDFSNSGVLLNFVSMFSKETSDLWFTVLQAAFDG